jgi:arginase family enzyme
MEAFYRTASTESEVSTRVIVFPFDLFGSGGSAAGAELLADELRTMLADNRRETVSTRAEVYTDQVRIKQVGFEAIEDYHTWRQQGRKLARQVLDSDDFFIWITGNHLGCLPVYDELSAREEPPLVVQLDAHLDIHQFTGYSREPSHGNFLLHVDGPLPLLVNIGHRELLLTDRDISEFYRTAIPVQSFDVEPIRRTCAKATSVLLDIDCDVLDSAYFPAVSRPVPFGLNPQQMLAVIEAAWSSKVRGLLLSEFDPGRDQADRSLSLLMWLLEYVLLRRYEKR